MPLLSVAGAGAGCVHADTGAERRRGHAEDVLREIDLDLAVLEQAVVDVEDAAHEVAHAEGALVADHGIALHEVEATAIHGARVARERHRVNAALPRGHQGRHVGIRDVGHVQRERPDLARGLVVRQVLILGDVVHVPAGRGVVDEPLVLDPRSR